VKRGPGLSVLKNIPGLRREKKLECFRALGWPAKREGAGKLVGKELTGSLGEGLKDPVS